MEKKQQLCVHLRSWLLFDLRALDIHNTSYSFKLHSIHTSFYNPVLGSGERGEKTNNNKKTVTATFAPFWMQAGWLIVSFPCAVWIPGGSAGRRIPHAFSPVFYHHSHRQWQPASRGCWSRRSAHLPLHQWPVSGQQPGLGAQGHVHADGGHVTFCRLGLRCRRRRQFDGQYAALL